jgi:large subunit ribosomal protein L19
MQNAMMELVEQSSMKEKLPHFEIGDTVDVHVRILEGEKERIQIFNGVVIARSGDHTREMFVVRRIVQGEGVERKFPVHSPRIADIVVKRSGKVRRAKLYFLRERSGKAVRLKERFAGGKATAAEAAAAKAEKRAGKIAAKRAKADAKASAKAEAARGAAAPSPATEEA